MDFRLFGGFSEGKTYERVAVGIISYPYTFFVINKGYNAIYFPGGTVEKGEDEISTLKRELKEELNLEIEKISKSYIETYVYSPKRKTSVLVKSYVGILRGDLRINEKEIEGVIIYPFDLIDESFLRWVNHRYLLGPSVVDTFIIKRKILSKMLDEILL